MESVAVRVATGVEQGDVRVRDLWLRPWSGEDVAALDISAAAHASPAARTSELLGRCLSLDGGATQAGSQVARELTVGDREALLLHLHRLTRGEILDLVAECSHCAERLELELRVGDLLVSAESPNEPEPWIELEDASEPAPISISANVRLPTGADLERAATQAAREDNANAAGALLRACLLEIEGASADALPSAIEQALAEQLSGLDPQAEIRLAASCPQCDANLELTLDAGDLVHAEIDRERERLFREVHVLALYYHWSEAEILAMSADRRRRYLELLARDVEEEA